jgi:hypothetical protein
MNPMWWQHAAWFALGWCAGVLISKWAGKWAEKKSLQKRYDRLVEKGWVGERSDDDDLCVAVTRDGRVYTGSTGQNKMLRRP